jgi:Mrp family chromosome partitioning ATPase
VYLVCADVFGPTASALLGTARPGLAEVLAGETPLEAAGHTLPSVPNLRILTPGLDPDRADALLQTKGPRKLVDELLDTASYVVIEAPPTSDSPDAQTLAGVADLAVLVVEAEQSSAREVIDAVAQVQSMHAAVLGAVVARYGRDDDADQKRRAAAAPSDDDVDEVPRTEEVSSGAARPADDEDEHEHEAAVLPTGGRPQLVPPRSAGTAQR